MAIHKVLGTETEYGIVVRGDVGFNPAVASSLVVNSYPGARVKIQWSYEEESPGRDARGFGHDSFGVVDPEGAVVNSVLANGARLYVDHAHPEYSSPESYDPLEAALYDKAGERVMQAAAAAATEVSGKKVSLYKNNSDGKGNSYGAHENYLLSRETPFGEVIRYATTFLVTRQIFTGAGKVGSENDRPPVDFQITQRADFFEEEVGLETTLKRPIINTRDEPHGDPSKYRRLHVIIGDANLSETQNFLKMGTTALMLAALEDGALARSSRSVRPGRVVLEGQPRHRPRQTARARRRRLRHGPRSSREIPGVALQIRRKGAGRPGLGHGHRRMGAGPRSLWMRIRCVSPTRSTGWPRSGSSRATSSATVSSGPTPSCGRSTSSITTSIPSAASTTVSPPGAAMRRLFDDAQIDEARVNPPTRTRAYFRGRCVSEFSDALVAANWDSLVFDVGESHLKRVPMMEPLRGDAELVGAILDEAEDAADLLRRLGG